jgi:hypothetical protein
MIARRWIGAAAICACLLTTAPCRAGNRTFLVALDYASAPDCPDEGVFRAVVSGRLDYDAFSNGASTRVLVHVAAQGRTYEGTIEWRDAAGKWQGDRTFPSRSNDCRELVRAMGFALALQIQLLTSADPAPVADDAATAKNSQGLEAPSAPRAAPATAPPSLEERSSLEVGTARAPQPASGESGTPIASPTFSIGVGGLVAFGMSSDGVGIGRLFGSIAWPFVTVEVAAEAGPAAEIRRQDGSGFTHQELVASLAGCGTAARWRSCLVAKGGEIRIAGRDIDSPRASSGPFLQAGLRLGVMQPLGRRWFVSLKTEALTTLTRSRVTLDSILVWTSPRFAGTLGLDLGVRFQ